MALTGTYQFQPSTADLGLYAFHLCGIRPNELTQQHMQTLVIAANIVQGEWSARGVNLWKVELVTIPFVQGVKTYSVDPSVVTILDLYSSVGPSNSLTDRYLLPVSRTEYATYANKESQGPPTVYWLDRLLQPSVTFYLVPDGNQVSFSYYAVQQMFDADVASAAQPDIQYYFTRAYAYGLARELSLIWAAEKFQLLSGEAEKAFEIAASQNVENNSVYFSPTLSSYWRT